MMSVAFAINYQLATINFLSAAFITPWFFAAGGALTSIPIIIHLLNRRRFKTVVWAAMEYLLQAMKKNRRRLKFEQWMLLAVRCLVLIFLGLALARPLGCQTGTMAGLVGQRNGLHIFVVDNAYTMAYEAERPGAKTHLDQAKRIIKDRMDKLIKSGESVAIVTAARPATVVIAKPSYSLDVARQAIDRIEQSYSGPDLPTAIQKAIEIASSDNAQTDKTLYLFTDGTRAAWENGNAEALRTAGHDAERVFGANHIHHTNLGKPSQWNQAVLELHPVDNIVSTQFNASFVADVKGFGSSTGDPILEWKIDDSEAPGGGRALKLDQNTQPQLLANRPINTGGPHIVSVSIRNGSGDDHLKADNTRYRVVDVASELKVLIVEGERGLGAMSGSGSFLELALAPPKNITGVDKNSKSDSDIAPEVISDLELPSKLLAQYRAVILTNVAQIPEAQADQLRKFVDQGGSLMLFMGSQINAENYNRILGSEKRQLLPGKLVKQVSSSGAGKDAFLFDFKPEGNLSTYLTVFKGEANSGLGTARIFNYWQVELPANFAGERVLDYQAAAADNTPAKGDAAKGDPAITVHPVGRGRVTFVSTTANADWTSFPAKPAYVTLVHELLNGTIGSSDTWLNLAVGQPVEIPPTLGLTAAPKLLDSAKKEIAVNAITGTDGQIVYRSSPLRNPGIYTLNTGSRSYPIAVNVPGDSADVRTLPGAAIKKALGDISLSEHDDQLMGESTAVDEGRDMGWTFMLIVLALVGAECFMAMRFGHYRRGGIPGAAPAPSALPAAAGALGTLAALDKRQRIVQNMNIILGLGIASLMGDLGWLIAGAKEIPQIAVTAPLGMVIGVFIGKAMLKRKWAREDALGQSGT